VNEPLALLLCERGLIATQLTQRLEALRYRLHVVGKSPEMVAAARSEKAMIILADVEGNPVEVVQALAQLRADAATAHIPVIAFAREMDDQTQADLVARGATMAVNEVAILSHLAQLLDRALEI
jgi:CheY-like chemotaxis protein